MEKDPLFANKLASAVLVALLLIFGLPLLAHSFYDGGGHGSSHGDDHGAVFPQYPIEVELGATAAVVEKKADLGAMMSEMTSEQGERGTLICKSCHTFNKGGPHLTGPNLWDIVNRPVGKVAGYTNYSDALKNDGGIWSYDRLDAFLKNSTAYIPGTAMAQKVRKDDKRAAMLVYLSTLSDSPVPFPALLVDQIESTLTGDDHSEEKTEDPGH